MPFHSLRDELLTVFIYIQEKSNKLSFLQSLFLPQEKSPRTINSCSTKACPDHVLTERSSAVYFFPIGQQVGAHDGAQTGIGGGGGGGGRNTGGGGGVQHCCGQILIQ